MPKNISRRKFICTTTVSAATLGVLAGALGLGPVSPIQVPQTRQAASGGTSATTLAEPLLVYVTDAANGEVTFLIGTRKTVVRDHALIARLARYVS